jgi:hypothetical protein
MPNNNSDKQLHLKQDQDRREEALVRTIATRLSRGNVSLQNGNFDTAEDLEKCRKSFENYEF